MNGTLNGQRMLSVSLGYFKVGLATIFVCGFVFIIVAAFAFYTIYRSVCHFWLIETCIIIFYRFVIIFGIIS